MIFFKQTPEDEEYIATFSEDKSKRDDSDKYKKEIDTFYRINRRITYKFCFPFLKQINSIYYCSFAKMPGVWLASCVRENMKYHLIGKVAFKDRNKYKIIDYRRQDHVVETCLRHLLRSEFAKFFGDCYYSITRYESLLRISIPFEKDFMIILNMQPKILADFTHLILSYYAPIIQRKKELIMECNKKLEKIKKEKMKKADAVADFFSNKPRFPELQYLLEDLVSTNAETKKRIRYISIGTLDGIPLARYTKKDVNLLLNPYDEFEYFIESISRMRMRQNIAKIFGNVQFTLSVYEWTAVMTILLSNSNPNNSKLLILISLENSMNGNDDDQREIDKEFYLPKSSVGRIFDLIETQNMEYITTGLKT